MSDWEIVATIASVLMVVLTAISAGVAWDAQNKASKSANMASQSAASAQTAADRANDLREEANRTANSALQESRRSNETADHALAEVRNANLYREERVRLEQLRQQIDQDDRIRELSANLRCKVVKGAHSGNDRSTWTFEIRNLGPALAEDARFAVQLSGSAFHASGTGHPRSLKADDRTEIEFSPRLAPYRSAIESDIYHIIATYIDAAHPDGNRQEWCFRFIGQGTEERIAFPTPEEIGCGVV